ncbi:acetyltransferase [Hypericibacter adhaerens]|uniref:Acetyltransferase n=1 Tax=Hypericibacter adhaerens TaxID=2602016 RepID=A0A5J6N3I2_9PROT|nr:GNAT family N-acetyltransferase [Hypericibacter adhaerens]QEX24037.1 acetyltransferase [Hypericibacter adhaerens]
MPNATVAARPETAFRLRAASPEDGEAIAALLREAFAPYDGKIQPRPGALSETGASIAAALENGAGSVAEAGGLLVGSVLWHPEGDGFYLGRLAVKPGWQRRGIARALVESAIEAARIARRAQVTLNVRILLPDNVAFFESLGFERAAARPHPGFDHPTYYVMVRRVD